MKDRLNSIRFRLLLTMMVTGLVPLVIMLVTTRTLLNRSIFQSEEEKVSDISRQLALHIGEVMDRAARDLESLKTNPFLSNPEGSRETKLGEMHRLVGVHEIFTDISLYDAKGFLLETTTDENQPSFKEYSTWFQEALDGDTVISHPRRRIGEEGLFLTVYMPVLTSGEIREVIKARLSFNRVMSLLEGVKVGDAGVVVLLDAWGNMISGPGTLDGSDKFDDRYSIDYWASDSVGQYQDLSGIEFLYSSRILPSSATQVDSPWVLLVMKPMQEVRAVLVQAQFTLAAAALGMMLVAAGSGLVLSRHFSRPLEKLGHAARLVAAGNLSIRAETGGSEEMDQLASSFNLMVEELGEHRDGLEKLVLSRTESLRRSQSELERTSARLQAAIDSTNNGFLVENLEGDVALVNQLFLDLVGVPQESLISNTADGILQVFARCGEIPDGGFEGWEVLRRQGKTIDCEVTLSEPTNRVLHVYSSPIYDRRGKLVGRVWNTQDLTQQRELEDSLRQSQKMEAIGQLAGGVAHDFNNLLTGILGNLALVSGEMEREQESSDLIQNLNLAIKAGERAAELVRQLLGFSRRSKMDLKPCDANIVLDEVRDILMATIDRRVRIALDLEESPWKVMADLGLLSQVIMNMGVNAKDAMPKGGTLHLRSRNRFISVKESRIHADAAPGDYLCLTVEDNGEGIPLEVQKRIFEPFFTTKGPGKGTGLGLATSFGIVKQLGGWIEMDSRPGEGTRFDIYLPRSAAAEAQPVLVESAVKTLEANGPGVGCTETILIIDDEDVVRHVARTLLRRLGYHVIEARDGIEGLAAHEAHRDSIDLVLLDLSMPNLSGRETFRCLRERDSGVPVLICSGYLVDLNEFTEECGACPNGFVQKPYRFEDISATIRKVLDTADRAA